MGCAWKWEWKREWELGCKCGKGGCVRSAPSSQKQHPVAGPYLNHAKPKPEAGARGAVVERNAYGGARSTRLGSRIGIVVGFGFVREVG